MTIYKVAVPYAVELDKFFVNKEDAEKYNNEKWGYMKKNGYAGYDVSYIEEITVEERSIEIKKD